MNFQSFGFLAFLALTASVCCAAARRNRSIAAKLLSLACLVFYIAGDGWAGLLVLAAGTAVSAAAVHFLCTERSVSAGRGGSAVSARTAVQRRRCLFLAAAWHIGVLAVFKYSGFLTGGRLSIGWVPLGLSFFTFQQLWLLKEAYTAGFRLCPGDLPLYVFFFPTVVSGPILKPQAFFPQLQEDSFLRPSGQDLAAGLYALCCGMVKKVLLADNLGILVNNGWQQAAGLSVPTAWLVILGYTLQLYLDFSGYCDIAAGAARLFGVRLPVNFDSPYRSLSVGEFWKRWHITLTSFLRECLYIPLGGSRRGSARTYANIILVFLVSGLWHGAGWTFLLWGGLHGLAQVLERVWGPSRERLPRSLRWALTFLFVNLAWVFFRAPTLSAAGDVLSAALTGGWSGPEAWLMEGLFEKEIAALARLIPQAWRFFTPGRLLLLYGGALTAVLWPRNTAGEMDRFRPGLLRGAALAALTAWAILSFTGVTTFIYSNF